MVKDMLNLVVSVGISLVIMYLLVVRVKIVVLSM